MVIISKYSNTVEYNLKTTLDASGISKLQAEIRKTQDAIKVLQSQELLGDTSATKAIQEIEKLQRALTSSFNSRVGMLDMSKFQASLASSNTSLVSLQKEFRKAGTTGDLAFNQVIGRIGKLDTGIKNTSKTVDKIFNTIGNTVRWGIISSGFNQMTNSIYKSVEYIKELDNSLTQIMLVTDYSRENMNAFAKDANNIAKSLGSTTTAMTNASLVFAQQGFGLDQSKQLAELSTKLANASQQDTSTTSDQITAYMNAYGLDKNLNELSAAMDSWAEVANVSAADVAELATASQKAASTANTVGVSMDQLNGQIAAIESVTREAPEQIGNGLKTLYARFSDLEAGETLEDGVTLGQVTSQLQKYGVNILDGEGQMRGVGDIMEDLMDVWQTLDQTQKAALAQTVAGRYQLSRFEALMNRSDLYEQYKTSSENADGTLDVMNEKYVDSLNGRLNKLQASIEGVFNSTFNTDNFYPVIDALTALVELMDNFIQSIGGGGNALLSFGSIATRVFRNQLAEKINTGIYTFMDNQVVKNNSKMAKRQLSAMGLKDLQNSKTQPVLDYAMKNYQYTDIMTDEQRVNRNKNLEKTVELTQNLIKAEDDVKASVFATNLLYQEMTGTKEKFVDLTQREDGTVGVEASKALLEQFQAGTALTEKDIKGYTPSHFLKANQASIDSLVNLSELASIYQLQGSDSSFEKFDTQLIKVKNNLNGVVQILTEFNSLDDIQDINKDLEKTDSVTKEIITQMQNFIAALDLSNEKDSIAVFSSEIDELLRKLRSAQDKANSISDGKIYENQNEVNQDNERITTSQIDFYEQLKSNQDDNQVLETQSRINQIVELTSAVGDLAFAWQSFQSLGSIWANEDLSFGEKLLQTITNLAFTLPQLTLAVHTLQNTMNTVRAAKGVSDTITSIGTSAVAAGESVGFFKTILSSLIPGGKLLTVALGGVAAALALVGFNAEAESQRVQKIKDTAETASQTISNLQSAKGNFDTLYEQYKNGEASSDQLKNAASSLNDILDDQSLKTQTLIGDWKSYSEALDDAAKKEAKSNQNSIKQGTWEAEREFVQSADMWNTVRARNNSPTIMRDSGLNKIYQSQNILSKTALGSWAFVDGTSAYERITALEEMNNAYISAIDNASGKQKEVLQEEYDNFTSFANSFDELKAQVKDSWTKEAETALLAYGNDENFQYDISETLDEYKDRLLKSGKFSSEGAVEAFVEGMASNDSTLAEAIANQAGKSIIDTASDKLSQKLNNVDLDNVPGVAESLSKSGINVSSLTDEQISAINKAIVQTAIDQVNNSSLSEEDKAELMNRIDWSQPIEQILAQMSQAAEAGNLDGVSIGNPEDYMNDERDARLEAYGVDEGTIDTYREIQEQTTGLGSRENELTENSNKAAKAAQKAADAYGETSDEYKNAAKQADKAADTLEAYIDTQEDLVDMSIQSQKGMEALSESIEDNAKILREGDTDSLEYAEAMDNTRQAVADLVNVSKDDISPQFVTDNLDLIEKAAYGDIDAIQQLRAAAANEILLEINKTGNLTPENLDYLQQKALELSGMTIEQYANLDDTQFVDALNNMLASGQMTADQVQSYLNSIGYDPVITEEPGPEQPIMTIKGDSIDFDVFGQRVGGITIPDMTIMGQATMPKIQSVQSIGSGGYTPVSSTARGNRPSGGSGGGGGGGGGSSYTPKENKDPISNTVDRYEKVNAQLGAIGADYEKINNEQERLTGDKLAENIQKQNELLLRQIEIYKEKLKIQQAEAEEVKNKLASQYGVGFDAEGFMTNYAAVHQQLIDEVNRLGNQYAGLGSQEAEDALNKQYEAAQKRLETFEELYQRYDELLSSDLKDTIQQIEDLEDAIEDMRIEMFKTSVEALDNLKEIRDIINEFNQSKDIWFYDDPFEKAKESVLELGEFWDGAIENVDAYYDELIAKEKEAAENATTDEGRLYHNNRILQLQAAKASQGNGSLETAGTGFFDMQFANVADMIKQIEEFEQNGSSSIFGENSAAMYETALDVLKQANDTLNDYKDKVFELKDIIGEMVDEILEKQEERQQAYEAINNELEHQIELITMIHGDQAYDQLKEAYAAQLTNTKNQISEMSQTLAKNKELLAQMEAAGDTSSDAYKALKDNITETQEELNSLVESSIENIRKQQELTVKSVTDAWINNALGTDLDWMQTEWELINRNADYYLDDVNKAYNIQKLQGKYLELLDQSNDLSIQNQITEQMKQQLEYLRDKKNLSEYDVQYANAQLEILQKRIALEEAQRNKSQMKLRRDSQGNYSYVYTANEGDVANAQGDLLDAQNNAYNLSKDQMKQTQEDSLSALADAKSMIDSIWTNANLSLEEKKARTETIIASLQEYLAATSEQLSTSETNIINDFIGMCESLTDENKTGLQETYEEIVNGNKEAFDQIDTRWSTSLTEWLQNLEQFNKDTEDKFDTMYKDMEDYESQIDDIGDLVGQNFDDMSSSIQGTVDKTEELRKSTQGFISDLEKMSGAVADAEQDLAYYRDKINDANNEMSMYQQKVNELASKLEQAERENANMRDEIQKMKDEEARREEAANGGGGGAGGSGGGSAGQGNSAMAWGIAQSIWTYGSRSGWGNDPIRSTKLTNAYGAAFARQVQQIINQNARSGKLVNYDSLKYSSYNLLGYDTGGYTGTWNDTTFDSKNGKLAVLHQKELVLNSSDTANILATVSAVRDLVAGFKTQANSILGSAFGFNSGINTTVGQDVNQNIHITADFPNVTSSSEIENALLSLNERAIQYAFKSK